MDSSLHNKRSTVSHRIESRSFVVVLHDGKAAFNAVVLGGVRDVKDLLNFYTIPKCQRSSLQERIKHLDNNMFLSFKPITPLYFVLYIITSPPNSIFSITYYTSFISKLPKVTNCFTRVFNSSLVSSSKRCVPNFSTQKDASAEPAIIALFMFSKEKSSVAAI